MAANRYNIVKWRTLSLSPTPSNDSLESYSTFVSGVTAQAHCRGERHGYKPRSVGRHIVTCRTRRTRFRVTSTNLKGSRVNLMYYFGRSTRLCAVFFLLVAYAAPRVLGGDNTRYRDKNHQKTGKYQRRGTQNSLGMHVTL
jgi:hypothetical protein